MAEEIDGRGNILFIMADQFRHDFLGCAGAGFVRTPNLDRLAERGVRFTQCCSNAPVCSPARIGLATGLWPWRLGAMDNDAYLPAGAKTYYQRLRDHEYRVGCVGKLDLAKKDKYNGRWGDRPCGFAWGFTHPEETEGKMHAGQNPDPQGPYGFRLEEQGLFQKFHEDYMARKAKGWIKGASHDSMLPAEAFEDVYIGRRAVEWIERIPDDFPWHFFVSFVGPHDPFDPPEEYGRRYRGAAMPPPIADDLADKPACRRRRVLEMTSEEVAVTRRQYCGLIELIDDQIGRILTALERRGWGENTHVVFSSDHGEMLGDHGFYTKSLPYESCLRVPFIVAGPGIARGAVSDALVELIDVAPTICELAGLPPWENIDGRSVAPILRGQSQRHRDDIIFALREFCGMRTDRWKLVRNYNAAPELYDLRNDPQELRNLAGQEPAVIKELSLRLRERLGEGKWRR